MYNWTFALTILILKEKKEKEKYSGLFYTHTHFTQYIIFFFLVNVLRIIIHNIYYNSFKYHHQLPSSSCIHRHTDKKHKEKKIHNDINHDIPSLCVFVRMVWF